MFNPPPSLAQAPFPTPDRGAASGRASGRRALWLGPAGRGEVRAGFLLFFSCLFISVVFCIFVFVNLLIFFQRERHSMRGASV